MISIIDRFRYEQYIFMHKLEQTKQNLVMKQQIITIIEKEGFLNEPEDTILKIEWNILEDSFELKIGSEEELLTILVERDFIEIFTKLVNEYNFMLVISDSDIINFKNNLITLINNYFK